MPDFAWMAWTLADGALLRRDRQPSPGDDWLAVCRPETEQVGVLRIPTTRGDRLFISLLGAAFIHLAWLGLSVRTELWWAFGSFPCLCGGRVPLRMRARVKKLRGNEPTGRPAATPADNGRKKTVAKVASQLLVSASTIALALGPSAALAGMEEARRWVDSEFQPSTLSKDEQMKEMEWFVNAAKPFARHGDQRRLRDHHDP